jgi:hypothetical protein
MLSPFFLVKLYLTLYGTAKLCRHISAATLPLLILGFLAAPQADGFALLNHPSDSAVQSGSFSRWLLDQSSPPRLELSYALDDDLLASVPCAAAAVHNAFSSWGQASTVLDFTCADYEPVVNSQANWIAGGYAWEGSGAAAGGTGVGANIDILARPSTFSYRDPRGRTFSFSSTSLAFAAPVTFSGTIVSVDIYLNSDFNWSTSGSGGYDLESVVLHEVGHALGLDHPDEAALAGSTNYHPYTLDTSTPTNSASVMHSLYSGVKRELTADEVGGIAFIYRGLLGDVNLDNRFSFSDVQETLDMFFYTGGPSDPHVMRNADINSDGRFSISDVNDILAMYLSPADPIDTASTLKIMQDLGYDTTSVPEPATAVVGMAAVALMIAPSRRGRT